jgi:hypothetical protein
LTFWDDIWKKFNYRPEIDEEGYYFQFIEEGGRWIFPAITRREERYFRQFLSDCVAFINEGMSAQHALLKTAKLHGDILASSRRKQEDMGMEPIVTFCSLGEVAEYEMTLIDQEFFVSRIELMPADEQLGIHMKWQLGNLRIKDKSGVFLPIIPQTRIEKERTKRIRRFRDEITKALKEK